MAGISAKEILPYNQFKGFKRLLLPFGYSFNDSGHSTTKHRYNLIKLSTAAHKQLLPNFEIDYDLLSGNKVIINDQFHPYALRYAGYPYLLE